jgi:hypothetical protein
VPPRRRALHEARKREPRHHRAAEEHDRPLAREVLDALHEIVDVAPVQ